MWKDFDSTFRDILNSLKQHNDLLDRLTHMLHIEQSQQDSQALGNFISAYTKDAGEIRAHIEQYKVDQDIRRQEAKQREVERKRERKIEVLQWVAAATMSDLHESFRQTRRSCPGSGQWIIDRERLRHWKDSDTPNNSVLWLHGIPGAGVLPITRTETTGLSTDFLQ